ncbi:MAG TPA: hypothetical protein VGM70_07620 [Pseudolysinimonas sp.]|jgi:hypothetical protein
MVPRRPIAIAVALALLAVLSGCTPLSFFIVGGASTATPTATRTAVAEPTPEPTRTPSPSGTPDCVTREITQAGTYTVGDCENLTVSGSGSITVTAGKIGTLTVRGDSLQVYALSIKKVDLQGQLDNIQTSEDLGALVVTGDRNVITCHGLSSTVVVNGNDNTVTADGGFGTVQDNGQRNAISALP